MVKYVSDLIPSQWEYEGLLGLWVRFKVEGIQVTNAVEDSGSVVATIGIFNVVTVKNKETLEKKIELN